MLDPVGLVVTLAFVMAAIVNLAPAVGMLSDAVLVRLYGLPIDSKSLSLLLRHRAVLFAIVGGLLLFAAFDPPTRLVAGIAGLVSMMSFVLIARIDPTKSARLERVATVDVIASVILAVGLALEIWQR